MQRFKNILFVTNAATGKEAALERGVSLARKNQARLTVVDVIEELPREKQTLSKFMPPLDVHESFTWGRRRQSKAFIPLITHERVQMVTKILWGTPFLEIIREVIRNQHDLVMITAEGNGGLKERLLGSTNMHLMCKCPCPVWTLKPTSRQSCSRILAVVDPAPCDDERNALNEKIIELGSSLAELEGSELHIVHTWTSIIEHISRRYGGLSQTEVGETAREIQKKHQRQLDELLGKYALENLKHQVHLLKGEAGRLIPELANQLGIQLIVMGTVCRTGVAGFFIDNTGAGQIDAVLYPQPSYHVDCSVLAVKPDGFVTPVTLEES